MVWGPSEDPAGRKSCKISSNLAWIFLVFLHVYELCKILNQMLKESYGITVHLLQLFCFISFIFFSSKRERETKKEVGAGRAQSFLFEFVFSLNFFIFFFYLYQRYSAGSFLLGPSLQVENQLRLITGLRLSCVCLCVCYFPLLSACWGRGEGVCLGVLWLLILTFSLSLSFLW